MTWNQIYAKYNISEKEFDRTNLTEEQHKEFVVDCYYKYEEDIAHHFWTPYEQYQNRIGQKFQVIARLTDEDNDIEVLPMWTIKFKDGFTIDAYPEEIITYEQFKNGKQIEC